MPPRVQKLILLSKSGYFNHFFVLRLFGASLIRQFFVYSAENFVCSASFSFIRLASSCIRPLNKPRSLKITLAEYAQSYSASSLIRLNLRLFGENCRQYRTKKGFEPSVFGRKLRLLQTRSVFLAEYALFGSAGHPTQ